MVDFEQDHNGISSHNCLQCNIFKIGVPMATLHPGSLCLNRTSYNNTLKA